MSQNGVVMQGQILQVLNERMRIIVTGAETDGKYVMVEATTQPNDGVPLLHTHPVQETFYIVKGEFEIYRRDDNGEKIAHRVTAGDVVHVPANEPHGYFNVGETPGTMLLTYDPGTMENFFVEVGRQIQDGEALEATGPEAMGAIMAACPRYGIAFVEAPPEAN